jgi:hypothetical protein
VALVEAGNGVAEAVGGEELEALDLSGASDLEEHPVLVLVLADVEATRHRCARGVGTVAND